MSEYHRNVGGNEWIDPVAHEVACANVYHTTFENVEASINIAAITSEQEHLDRESYHALLAAGLHLIPLDHNEVISSDMTMHEVYAIGTSLALATLDSLCDQLDIDIDKFRNAWRINGLVTVLDQNDKKVMALSDREKYEAVATGIMALGHQVMDQLGSVYEPIIDATKVLGPDIAANPGVLRASYGYVLGGGLKTLNRILEELEIRRFNEEIDSETSLQDWMSHTPVPAIDRASTLSSPDHNAAANQIDTQLFWKGESVEFCLGSLTEKYIEKDKRVVETLHALARVSYPNELDNFALDDAGEAFFYGSVLALDAVMEQSKAALVDEASLSRAWRDQRVHGWLSDMYEVPETRIGEIDNHLVKVLTRQSVAAYDDVLEKVSGALDYDEDEAMAFYNGFHYLLSTGGDAISSCTKANIAQQVKHEMLTMDDELRRLLEG